MRKSSIAVNNTERHVQLTCAIVSHSTGLFRGKGPYVAVAQMPNFMVHGHKKPVVKFKLWVVSIRTDHIGLMPTYVCHMRVKPSC